MGYASASLSPCRRGPLCPGRSGSVGRGLRGGSVPFRRVSPSLPSSLPYGKRGGERGEGGQRGGVGAGRGRRRRRPKGSRRLEPEAACDENTRSKVLPMAGGPTRRRSPKERPERLDSGEDARESRPPRPVGVSGPGRGRLRGRQTYEAASLVEDDADDDRNRRRRLRGFACPRTTAPRVDALRCSRRGDDAGHAGTATGDRPLEKRGEGREGRRGRGGAWVNSICDAHTWSEQA